MKILYGGTFNPPTKAHYEIAEFLLKSFPQASLILLPTANHYHKPEIIDFSHRYKMLQIVARNLGKRVEVSDFEEKLDHYYGTAYTLKHFNHPYFVMGADNLINIKSWINYPNIVIENKFIIFPRDNIDLEKVFSSNEILSKYRNNFIVVDDFSNIDISSSNYRKTKNSHLLLPEVKQYIKDNNLYKEEP